MSKSQKQWVLSSMPIVLSAVSSNATCKKFIATKLDTTSSAIAESDFTSVATGLDATSSFPLFDVCDGDVIWNDSLARIAEGDYDEDKKIAAI